MTRKMMEQNIEPGKRKGNIHIPSSKSDAQRAILAAALAKGNSTIHNFGKSADELSMLNAVQVLGAIVEKSEHNTIVVTGIKAFPEKVNINIGESGLGLRLLTSICAAHVCEAVLNGNGSLLKRPMHFFDEVFPILGVSIKTNNGFLPFELKGPMYATEISVDGSQSSQYISGLLMALPLLAESTVLEVENVKSIPYIRMTLDTLSNFGIAIQHKDYKEFLIKGNQQYLPAEHFVDGDWSSASYWLVASALGADVFVKGLSLASLQADKKILDALISAGCSIINSEKGISIDGKERHPFVFDATHCPDLFPALVLFASLTEGISKIKGVHRLKHKESDRGAVLKEEFAKLGIEIELVEDIMLIHGKKAISGGKVISHNDHRIAMCLGIAGFFASSSLTIQGAESVNKSYPDFWKHVEQLDVIL